MRRLSRRQFSELTNVGFGGIMGAYAARLPLTFEDGEEIGEKARRQLYRQRFGLRCATRFKKYRLTGPLGVSV